MDDARRNSTNQVQDLKERTKQFALRIIRLVSSLPKLPAAQVIGHQLLRAGTSVGAHYCEACRGRSGAEFVAKLNGGLIELEESAYWLELLEGAQIIAARRLAALQQEATELTAIFVTLHQERQAARIDRMYFCLLPFAFCLCIMYFCLLPFAFCL